MDNKEKKINFDNFDEIEKKVEIARKKSKRTKIIIISVFALMIIFMVVCLLVPGLLNGTAFDETKNSDTPKQYIFYDPYPENFDIFQYPEYINRGDLGFIYADGTTSEELTDSSIKDYNPGVQVMYKMINAIKHGDERAYNALLSDKIEKKKPFTQQQVYAILVTNVDNNETDGESYYFKVEYKIRQNNGSFRTDIGSDMAKIQYFTVRNIDGKYFIDSITESNNK